EFLLHGTWSNSVASATYRTVYTEYRYDFATTVLTPAQQASWPSGDIYLYSSTSVDFHCGSTTPYFTSTPPTQMVPGGEISYTAHATSTDPNVAAAIQSEALDAPSGYTLDPSTGLFQWAVPSNEGYNKAIVIYVEYNWTDYAIQGWLIQPNCDDGN